MTLAFCLLLTASTIAQEWLPVGPSPIEGGQVENITPNDEVNGAINAVQTHPTNPDIIFIGGVNSGVWKTENATALNPTWVHLTDTFPSLAAAELNLDPTDATWNTLVVGMGRSSSLSGLGGDRIGLLRTTDGGATWTHLHTLAGSNISGVASRGTIIVAAANTADSGSPTGLFRSTDSGATWSAPVRVNDDPIDAWQWFGTMSASPSGRIDAVWLDTRRNPGTYLSSLYYSYSVDGGQTWSADERLSDEFDPHMGWPNQNKMGDYFHMVSDDTGFSLAWAATFNGEQDVYYGRKTLGITAVDETQDASLALIVADPNPFTASTTIRYDVPRGAFVTLAVYDMAGRKVATLVSSSQSAGSHQVQLDGRTLASGVYLCRLSAGTSHDTEKLLIVK